MSGRSDADPATVELRWTTEHDVELVLRCRDLFDRPPAHDSTERFVRSPGHHLCIAMMGGEPVGFVSGVETTHPDKGTEMFLYELGVDDAVRGRGIGSMLVSALRARAAERGCHSMWVVTEPDNLAALATYRGAAPSTEESTVTLVWEL